MLVQSADYSLTDFKDDEEKRKQENPSELCPASTPYGTEDGCVSCQEPEKFFLLETRRCTTIKRTINFEGVGDDYLTG